MGQIADPDRNRSLMSQWLKYHLDSKKPQEKTDADGQPVGPVQPSLGLTPSGSINKGLNP